MRWTAVPATVATTALLVALGAPAAAAAEPGGGQIRYDAVGASATWGWHKIAHLPDGTRTFRTGFLLASYGDVREKSEAWSEENVYAHTEDYTYRGDDSFVGRVNRIFLGTRDTVTVTVSDDYWTARVTGTMVETVCDTHYEVCTETGPVAVDVSFAAVDPPTVYTNDTARPSPWQGQMQHVFAGGTTYQPGASGTIGPVTLPTTYAANYAAIDALVAGSCRNVCEYLP